MFELSFDTPNRVIFNETIINGDRDVILGKGSFGLVFKAQYKKNKVAVKIISKENDFKFASLEREKNVLNITHRNIIKILQIVETKEYGAIIMERFDNSKNLQYILDHLNRKIDLIHRLRILQDIAKALLFCHDRGIIHSDLKPDNIMLVAENRNFVCKIFDFGCSHKIEGSMDCEGGNSSDENNTGIVGTVRYSAPEVLQGIIEANPPIDIYSFGIIMWQLKENEIPYESIKSSNEIIVWQVVKYNLRPDSTLLLLTELNEGRGFQRRSRKRFYSSDLMSVEMIRTPNSMEKYSGKTPRSDFKRQKSGEYKNLSRKKLFDCKSIDLLADETTEGEELPIFFNLLIDHQLHLRNRKKLHEVENEYIKLYKACWDKKQYLRPIIHEICSKIEKFIAYI